MIRLSLNVLIVCVAMAVSACTLSPVYSDGSPISAMSLAFDLGSPNSRTEQVIYQELALRFATTTAPNTPVLTVSTRSRVTSLVNTKRLLGIEREREVTVTAAVTATYNNKVIFSAIRRATANFEEAVSILSNQQARQEAEERAAKSAAESLRLAILATFPRNGSY